MPGRLQNEDADSGCDLQDGAGQQRAHRGAGSLLSLHHWQIHAGTGHGGKHGGDPGLGGRYCVVHCKVGCGRGPAGAAYEAANQAGEFKSCAPEVAHSQRRNYLNGKKQERQAQNLDNGNGEVSVSVGLRSTVSVALYPR